MHQSVLNQRLPWARRNLGADTALYLQQMGLTWIKVSLETTTITALLRMAEASKVR